MDLVFLLLLLLLLFSSISRYVMMGLKQDLSTLIYFLPGFHYILVVCVYLFDTVC